MKLITPRTLLLSAGLLMLSSCSQENAVATVDFGDSSWLIENADIYDGSGGNHFSGDLRIIDGIIIEVGDLTPKDGEKTWDASGFVLSPGFIDPHSHADSKLMDKPASASLLAQGITTIVSGLDGFLSKFGEPFVSVADNMAHFEKNPAAVNLAIFGPHNTYRAEVMGDDYKRLATAAEIEQMKALLARDMSAGALGLGAGLEYEPAIYSSTDEIVELAKVASEFGGRYSSHIRSEDVSVTEAFEEVVIIAREANVPVNISHVKLAITTLYGASTEFLANLDTARQEGLDITADIYPYDGWQSTLAILIPSRDYEDREAAEYALNSLSPPHTIMFSNYEKDPSYVGKTLEEVALAENIDPVDLLMNLLQTADKEGKSISIIGRNINDEDILTFMRWPHTAITTDGAIDDRHPRGQGTYPRVLGRYVRENGHLSLTNAIQKMTSQAAKNLGFKDRGLIKEGYIADLVVFNKDTIIDHATFDDPLQYSSGIKAVWVGGQLVWENDVETGARPGIIIKRE